MSGVWVKVHPDQVGGGSGTLDPAELLSDPVAVSNATAPASYTVKLTDGSQKKIWFLPGNTSTRDQAVYSVTLSAGVLPGVMVGAGGGGGSSAAAGPSNYGAGGAGGVIGTGAHVPVILPTAEAATYTITVAGTTLQGGGWNETWRAHHTTLAVEGQTPFTAAVGGGMGVSQATNTAYSGNGASGGGGAFQVDQGGSGHHNSEAGTGIPGQGNPGNYGGGVGTGGGGGYGSGHEQTSDGGAGFDLATALMLDASDGSTKSFIDMVSVDGWIAGGGSGPGGTATAGGGAYKGNAKDYTGGGGGSGGNVTGGTGGAGMVLLVTEV
jgi:hypothetical protein